MNRYIVSHKTTYTYRSAVRFGQHRLVFKPSSCLGLEVRSAYCSTFPAATLCPREDEHGNQIEDATFRVRAKSLEVFTRLDVAVPSSPVLPEGLPLPVPKGSPSAIEVWARGVTGDATDISSALQRLVTWTENLDYKPRYEEGTQTPQETLRLKQGTCRDFSVLVMEGLRCLGFEARLAAGYLYNSKYDVHPPPSGGATHAWVQVLVPSVGWYDIDPTNGDLGNSKLIPLSVGPTLASIPAPVAGTWIGVQGDFIKLEVNIGVRSIPLEWREEIPVDRRASNCFSD